MTCLKVLLKRNLIFFSHCSINGYFTIEELNSRIQNFIGPKPSLIDSKPHAHDYNIRQSASQMISLLKEFPILIGDKIPEEDKHYYCLLLLIKIALIVLSPILSYDVLPYLDILVEEKIILFKELYPSSSIIPKMHFKPNIHYGNFC